MAHYHSLWPTLKTPPLTHAEFRKLVRKISGFGSVGSKVDRKVLSAAIQIIYYCGLKRHEIIELKIRDVLRYQNDLKVKPDYYVIRKKLKVFANEIDGYEYPVLIDNNANRILPVYLKYLLSPKHNYRTNPGSPLFPQKTSAKYVVENMRNHLSLFSKHISPASGLPINFDTIRHSGLFFYYNKMLKLHGSHKYALGRTAEFARNKRQHVYNTLF